MPQCPVCEHKHNFWNVDEMEYTHKDTEKFIEITGCHHKGEDGNGYEAIRIARLFGCPKCKIVFLGNDW